MFVCSRTLFCRTYNCLCVFVLFELYFIRFVYVIYYSLTCLLLHSKTACFFAQIEGILLFYPRAVESTVADTGLPRALGV